MSECSESRSSFLVTVAMLCFSPPLATGLSMKLGHIIKEHQAGVSSAAGRVVVVGCKPGELTLGFVLLADDVVLV